MRISKNGGFIFPMSYFKIPDTILAIYRHLSPTFD
jgi:hypothetical protein